MTLPQHVTFGRGGTISIDSPTLANAVTVTIRDGDGTVRVQDATATPSTINTTITGSISAGAISINVAANTGIGVDTVAWLRDDPEEILVSRVSTLAITLRRPAIYSHISGAQLQGSRIEYAVNSAVANTLWWDGYAEWNIDGTLDYTSVECTRYPLTRRASAQDLFDVEPLLSDVLDSEQDVERFLDAAHNMVLGEIGKMAPDQRVRVMPASSSFRTATALAAMYMHYRRRGSDEAREVSERYLKDMKRELDSITATNPRDADQDQDIELDEAISAHTTRLRRG
jgi:hypothetical protein